jgi:hypothetical protein
VGPPSINVQGWEVCHKESQITVSSRCLDTFDQIHICSTVLIATAQIIGHFPLPVIEPKFLGYPASSLVTVLVPVEN